MSSFSQHNAPPHEPAGDHIPSGVRRALLSWVVDRDLREPVKPRDIWRLLRQRVGYGEPQDVVDDVAARFGEDAALEVAQAFEQEMRVRRAVPVSDANRYALPALDTIPSALFLDALEIAFELLQQRGRIWSDGSIDYIDYEDRAFVQEINRLFGVRGIHYEFGDDGKARWTGDPGTRRLVVRPALEALLDARLSGAAGEYQAALDHLRRGTAKDVEDAIDEAAKAVESAMKVLLDEHSVPRGGKETAWPLFGLLQKAGVIEAESDNAILGAARIRNTWGGHGAGAAPREIPDRLAELAVHAAGSAITYLASRFP